jgi:hypothetical protein
VKTFRRICEIIPAAPETWEQALFLTFDIDWACDDVLNDTITLVERAGVPATWFVTHETPVLQRLRENPLFELGIHPNFNFLLEGDFRSGKSAQEVLDRVLRVVPEAKSVRSHSVTQNSRLLDLFAVKGLTHDCNHHIPGYAGILLKPWVLWNGLNRVPYFWADDLAFRMPDDGSTMKKISDEPGLKVFDFHPIHVFLNTEKLERYESTRTLHRSVDVLMKHRNLGLGTRTHLLELLKIPDDFSGKVG